MHLITEPQNIWNKNRQNQRGKTDYSVIESSTSYFQRYEVENQQENRTLEQQYKLCRCEAN